MAGGLGQVEVSIALNTASAEAQLKTFFAQFGKEKVGDPLGPLDKKFEKVAAAAKGLGYEWDNVSNKFKNAQGDTKNLDQMAAALKRAGTSAQDAGGKVKSFGDLTKQAGTSVNSLQVGTLATQLKTAGQAGTQASAGIQSVGNASQAAQGSLLNLAGSTGAVNTNLASVGKGGAQGLVEVKKSADGTSTSIDKLGNDAIETSGQLASLGKAGSGGISKIGQDALTTAGHVDKLGTEAVDTTGQLRNIGGNGASGLLGIGTAAKSAGTSLGQTKTAASGLTTALQSTGAAVPVVGSLGRALQGVGTSANAAQVPTTGLSTALRNAGQAAQPLGAVPPKIQAVGNAAQTASGATTKLKTDLEQTAKTASAFSQAIQSGFQQILQGIPQGIGIALGNALVAPLRLLSGVLPQAIEEYRQLDEVLRLTLAISGTSSEKFDELAGAVMRVGMQSAATNLEVGEVAVALARAGFKLDEIKAGLAGIVQGAEATGMGYAEMGDIVVSALGQFQLAATDTTDVVDTLVTAANNSNQSVTDLGYALKYVGPVANTVGQSLQETNVQLALLANSGIRASTAGTSLRTILTNLQIAAGGAGEEFTELSKGSGRLSETLKLIGADMTDANGELKTGTDLIYALQDSMKGLSKGEQAIVSKVLAGAEGLPALSAMINATGKDIENLAQKMDDRLGNAAKTQQQAMEGLAGAFKYFESNVSTTLGTIGSLAATVFTPVLNGITALLGAFNSLPAPVQNVIILMAAFAAGMAAVQVALKLLQVELVATFAGNITNAIKTFAAQLTGAGIAQALNQAAVNAGIFASTLKAQLLAGIGAATTALQAMTLRLQAFNAATIASKGMNLVNGLKDIAKGALEAGKGLLNLAKQAIANVITSFKTGAAATTGQAIQLGLLGPASLTAASGMTAAGTAATGAGAAMAGAAPGAAAAAGATTAAGVAAGGAAGGFTALLGAMGPFLIAIAPIAAIVGAVVAAFVVWNKYASASSKIQEKLAGDTNKLNDVLDKGKDSAEASAEGNKSWYESMHNALGPLSMLLKACPVLDLALRALLGTVQWLTDKIGLFFGYLKDNGTIDGLKKSNDELTASLGRAGQKIEENKAKMAGLNMESDEYRNLLAENIRIEQASVDALEGRISKLDEELKALDANGQGQGRVATAMREQKKALEEQLSKRQESLAGMQQELQLADQLAGGTTQVANSYQALERARNDAYGAIDTQLAQDELVIMAQVKEGLLSETEARAMNAKAAMKQLDEKLAADEEYIVKLKELYEQGKISEEQYITKKGEVTAAIKEQLKDRADTEKAMNDAIKAAINERLDKYAEEQQTIASNVQAINSSLQELGSINSSAITAFKSLADASTNYELAGIEKVKAARLKTIDATYKDGAAKEAAKQRVEREFEAEKLRILQDQQTFNEQAQRATFAAKQAELDLWYAQQTIQNQLAQTEAEIAVVRAQANGASQAELDQLNNVVRLTQFQGELLGDQYALKGQLLQIENQAAEAGLAAEARAKGVNTAFSGSVANVKTLAGQMNAFTGKVQSVVDKAENFKSTLGTVGTVTAQQVADQVRDKLNQSLGQIDTKYAEDQLRKLGIPPEVAKAISEDMTSAVLQGSVNGVDAAKMKVTEVFRSSGFVPKQLIQDDLVAAFQAGGSASVTAAKNEFDKLPDNIPFEKIAEILGKGLKGGKEAGQKALSELTLDPETVKKIQEAGRKGLQDGGDKGAEAFNKAVKDSSPKLESAVSDGVKSGLGKAEKEVNDWSGRVGQTVNKALQDSGKNIGTGFKGELDKVLDGLGEKIGGLGDKLKPEKFKENMNKAILEPIKQASDLLSKLSAPKTLGEGAEALKNAFNNAVKAGLGKETKDVANASAAAARETNKIPGALRSAVSSSAQYARNMEKAAAAAEKAARNRWGGGPVSPGTTYTVNELGREMFMSNTGRVSEIRAPRFGSWTPPTSGTVIPAGLAEQVRDSRASKATQFALAVPSKAAATKIQVQQASADNSGLQRALVRELQKLGEGGPVSNNITIQSAAPVNDASRMLAEMNRLRAYRR